MTNLVPDPRNRLSDSLSESGARHSLLLAEECSRWFETFEESPMELNGSTIRIYSAEKGAAFDNAKPAAGNSVFPTDFLL